MSKDYTVADATCAMLDEVKRAGDLWPDFRSAHEGFAILLEEVDELKPMSGRTRRSATWKRCGLKPFR